MRLQQLLGATLLGGGHCGGGGGAPGMMHPLLVEWQGCASHGAPGVGGVGSGGPNTTCLQGVLCGALWCAAVKDATASGHMLVLVETPPPFVCSASVQQLKGRQQAVGRLRACHPMYPPYQCV
jgi:hypothetical protein